MRAFRQVEYTAITRRMKARWIVILGRAFLILGFVVVESILRNDFDAANGFSVDHCNRNFFAFDESLDQCAAIVFERFAYTLRELGHRMRSTSADA